MQESTQRKTSTASRERKSSITKEDIINQYRSTDIPDGKSIFCRFYRRGCCLFSATECKFAHTIADLKFKKLDLEEFRKNRNNQTENSDSNPQEEDKNEDNEEETIGQQTALKFPETERDYKSLYDYQIVLKSRGEVDKIYTLDELNKENKIRREIKEKLFKELQLDFLNFLYQEYKSITLEKAFIDQCFRSVHWKARWKSLFGNVHSYRLNPNNPDVSITKKLEGAAFDDYMEANIIRIIKDMDLIYKLPISPSAVTQLYYSYLGQLDSSLPPHMIYLKQKKVRTMEDYLGILQQSESFKIKLAEACSMPIESLAEVEIFDRHANELQNLVAQTKSILADLMEKSHLGLVLFSKYESKVTSKCSQALRQYSRNPANKRKLLMRIPQEDGVLILNIDAEIYLFSPVKLGKGDLKEILPKYSQELDKGCKITPSDSYVLTQSEVVRQGITFEVTNRQTEEFLKEEIDIERIVVVDNQESLEFCAKYFEGVKVLGVDIEGRLKRGGRIDLIQCSAKEKIFIFDVHKVKKMANEDPKNVQLYYDLRAFLKKIMENPEICKVFHDGRKDSVALHSLLDICPSNVFDSSAVETIIGHMINHKIEKILPIDEKQMEAEEQNLQENLSQEKPEETKVEYKTLNEKNKTESYMSSAQELRLPSLNDVLERYKASSGLNRLKGLMKERFHTLPKEHFQQRPIDKEFLIYAAKDVDGLIEVNERMKQKMKEIVEGFVDGNVENQKIDLLCREISKIFIEKGCRKNTKH